MYKLIVILLLLFFLFLNLKLHDNIIIISSLVLLLLLYSLFLGRHYDTFRGISLNKVTPLTYARECYKCIQ